LVRSWSNSTRAESAGAEHQAGERSPLLNLGRNARGRQRLRRKQAEADEPTAGKGSPAEALQIGMQGTEGPLPFAEELAPELAGSVRCFFGEAARAACQMVSASAFTVGNVIVFAEDAPSKETVQHELAHVQQQGGEPAEATESLEMTSPEDPEEQAAEQKEANAGASESAAAEPKLARRHDAYGPNQPGPGAPVIQPGDMSSQPHPGTNAPAQAQAPPQPPQGGASADRFGPNRPGPGAPTIQPGDMSSQPHPAAPAGQHRQAPVHGQAPARPPQGQAPQGQAPQGQAPPPVGADAGVMSSPDAGVMSSPDAGAMSSPDAGAVTPADGGARGSVDASADPFGPNQPAPGAPAIQPGDMSSQPHPNGPIPEPATMAVSHERSLRSDEIGEAATIFGASLNVGAVTLTQGNLLATGSTRTVGNTIHFEDEYFIVENGHMTDRLTDEGKRVLVHELTHVWQFQHGGMGYATAALAAQGEAAVCGGGRNDAYRWREQVAEHVPWARWNPEQQASLVEDYNRALHNINDAAAGRGVPSAADVETVNLTLPFVRLVQAGVGASHHDGDLAPSLQAERDRRCGPGRSRREPF
jgi:hypothetical protein